MAYRAGTEELLARLAENLDRVVDPALRQRLMGQYLGLLQEWHNGRRGAQYDAAVRGLWNQVTAGTVQYKLWPGLGTIHGQFYDARDSALSVLDRLGALAGRQKDLTLRRRWLAELADFRGELNMLNREAQMASTNVALSRLDSLAGQAANLTAQKLIPRLQEWSAALKVAVPSLEPGGESGAVSIASRPDLWHGLGADDKTYEFFEQASQGAFGASTDAALVEAQKKYVVFQGLVIRLKAAQGVQRTAEAALTALAKSPNFTTLQADVEENRRQLDSAVASVKSLAAELQKTPVTSWDAPGEEAAALGSLTPEQGAAMLLYSAELDGLVSVVESVEKRLAATNAALGIKPAGVSSGVKAGAAIGLGILALIALKGR